MRKLGLLALVGIIGVLLLPSTVAQDERFAVRFGLIALEPTGDSTIQGSLNELSTAFGATGAFEWYFAPRVGLEGSMAFAIDADVESNNDVVAGVSVVPITFGINWHPVRTQTIDWGIGAIGGPVIYADFKYDDTGSSTTTSVSSDTDFGYGLQTFLDWGFAMDGRWGMSFGVKWLKSDFDVEGEKLSVDPLIVSVMGKFTF